MCWDESRCWVPWDGHCNLMAFSRHANSWASQSDLDMMRLGRLLASHAIMCRFFLGVLSQGSSWPRARTAPPKPGNPWSRTANRFEKRRALRMICFGRSGHLKGGNEAGALCCGRGDWDATCYCHTASCGIMTASAVVTGSCDRAAKKAKCNSEYRDKIT